MSINSGAPKYWVFLRGLAREQGHWGDFVTRAERELGWNILTLDVLGCGVHSRVSTPASVAAMVEGLRQELERSEFVGIDRFGLLGLSLGGMLACQWAAIDARVGAQVLINSSSADSPFWWRFLPSALPVLLRALLSRSALRRESLILSRVSNACAADGELQQVWADIYAQRPVSNLNVLRMLWAAGCYRLPADVALPPTLLLASRADRLVDWRCSRTLAERLDAPLKLHGSAGHELPLDDPDWVLEQIRLWQRGKSASAQMDGLDSE